MKKLFFLYLLFPFVLFGFTNLKINNSTAPSVNVNDSLTLTGNFQGGDTSATIKFYYDANQNFTLDSGDKLVAFYKIYDGSPFDFDEIKNSYYSGYIPSVPVPMYMFVVGIDNGGADTISLLVNHISSSTTVSGNVTAGSNPADKIFVMASTDYGDYAAFTGTDGSYNIYLPDSLVGDTAQIILIDFVGNNPGYLGCMDSLVISGSDTKNYQLTFTDSTMLSGYIIDNLGDTLKDTATWFIGGGYLNGTTVQTLTAQTFLINGSYSMPIMKGLYFSNWEVDYSFLTDMYYPLYTNRKDTSLIVSGNTNFNILLFKNDSSIKGHVYVDGNGVDTFEVRCSATSDTVVGDMKTITYSDGRYILPVSTASDSYNVFVIVPDGYSCSPSLIPAACGDTGINFYLTQTGIKSEDNISKSSVKVKFINGKLLVSGNSDKNISVAVYDLIGSKVFEKTVSSGNGKFDLKLKNGVYFAEIKNGKNREIKKLVNIR